MSLIPDETDFVDNAVAIDPPGCGCTDCLTRQSVPADDRAALAELAVAAIAGRKVINRASGPMSLVAYPDGSFCWEQGLHVFPVLLGVLPE